MIRGVASGLGMRVTQHGFFWEKGKLGTDTGHWGTHLTDLNQMPQIISTDVNTEQKNVNIDNVNSRNVNINNVNCKDKSCT